MQFIPTPDAKWHPAAGEDGPQPHPNPQPYRLLTLEQWHAVRLSWPTSGDKALPTALLLANTADVDTLAEDLPRLQLLVLQFPKWTDGRAYSQARLLRQRHGYTGELRATGDVLVDMLPLLHRTGFSSVQLRPDQREESARRALRFFDEGHYQGDTAEPQPLFKRQAAA